MVANFGYGYWGGTSMSSPMVVGAAALIMAAYPNISCATVANVLTSTTQMKPSEGGDVKTGAGILDAAQAVQRVMGGLNCHNIAGDVNLDCYVNYADAEALAAYLTEGGTLQEPNNADVNASCFVDLSDLACLNAYVTAGGQNPEYGCFEEQVPFEMKTAVPTPELTVEQNYPNPFNPNTQINFTLRAEGVVRIEVFNVLGARIRTLLDKQMPTGHHAVTWDGTNESGQPVSSGVYFYRVEAGEPTQKRKMVLLK